MKEKHRYIQQGLGYRQIRRFPILKQDKHVRKRPKFTASGNAGRENSRGFGRF